MKLLKAFFVVLILISASSVKADKSETSAEFPWVQTDWSGGAGQQDWSDPTMVNGITAPIDYSVAGEISLNTDVSDGGFVYEMVDFDGLMYVQRSYGMFTYDSEYEEWDMFLPGHAFERQMFVDDGKLYGVHFYNVYVKDKTDNDYGLGPNGVQKIGRDGLPDDIGLHAATVFNGELYVAAVKWTTYSAGGYVYKYTDAGWVQVGDKIANAATSIAVYNNELYCGTHWSGQLYKWSGGSWTNLHSAGMSLTALQVWKNKLYIGSKNTNESSGAVHVYDGNSFSQVYSGPGVMFFDVDENNLYFGGQGDRKLYQYNGSSVAVHTTLSSGANGVGGVCVYDGSVYTAAGYMPQQTNSDISIYKNGEVLNQIHMGIVNSSIYSFDEEVDWGYVEFDYDYGYSSGIEVFLKGKSVSEEWRYGDVVSVENGDYANLMAEQAYYSIVMWSVEEWDEPYLSEIRIGTEGAPAFDVNNIVVKPVNDHIAAIYWETSRPSTDIVFFGNESDEDFPYEAMEDGWMTLNHTVNLEALSIDETYYFVIFSTDQNYDEFVSDVYSFKLSDLEKGAPEIISVMDVPEDQGGWVYIDFMADNIDQSSAITQYGVWEWMKDEWVSVGTVPAQQKDNYTFLAHTYKDSTVAGIYWSKFKVTSHTKNPKSYYESDEAKGYSVDNLAPAAPTGFVAWMSDDKKAIEMEWSYSVESDFNYYIVYRNNQKYVTTVDNRFADSDFAVGEYIYEVAAVDFAGNISEKSEMHSFQTSSNKIDELLVTLYPNPVKDVIHIEFDNSLQTIGYSIQLSQVI